MRKTNPKQSDRTSSGDPTKHPLAEVFGFPCQNDSTDAKRHRRNQLCPFGNGSPNCTKVSATNPLGVCSVFDENHAIITCPVRFRENSLIYDDAAAFFFTAETRWTTLSEVRLKDKNGKAAGNVDVVVVAYNDAGKVTDFGALEIQAVYISGNVRQPFEKFMANPTANQYMDWTKEDKYPRPDFLSSSRKRLAPQLLFKGGIMNAWKKKTAVALQTEFFDTLPALQEIGRDEADLAWLIYDLEFDAAQQKRHLKVNRIAYTKFDSSLMAITRPNVPPVAEFLETIQGQLDEKLENGDAPDIARFDAPIQ